MDRRVVRVDYDGPEPEGLGTAEKLAIGAAAAIAVGTAASAMSKDEGADAAPTETAAVLEIRTRPNGQMEVLVPGGCTVLHSDLGLREQHGSSCSQEDLKQANKAMTAHLNEQGAAGH